MTRKIFLKPIDFNGVKAGLVLEEEIVKKIEIFRECLADDDGSEDEEIEIPVLRGNQSILEHVLSWFVHHHETGGADDSGITLKEWEEFRMEDVEEFELRLSSFDREWLEHCDSEGRCSLECLELCDYLGNEYLSHLVSFGFVLQVLHVFSGEKKIEELGMGTVTEPTSEEIRSTIQSYPWILDLGTSATSQK